jgi:GPI ethanolamine phosphate transferase 2/3 subunit F
MYYYYHQPTLLSLTLTLLLPPLPLALLALLIGAPISPYAHLPLTLLLAVHLSLLALLPLFYAHGVSRAAWRDVLAAWLPFDACGVWGGSVGGFVGGWLGAVPIALDWDREWQKWPVTVLVGVYLGWAVGRLLTASAGWALGRRINMDAPQGEEEHDAEVGRTRQGRAEEKKKKKKR